MLDGVVWGQVRWKTGEKTLFQERLGEENVVTFCGRSGSRVTDHRPEDLRNGSAAA
jgi:hypothetical protein